MYIDGSRPDSSLATGAGIAFEDTEHGYSVSLPRLCSNYTAEVFAIRTGLEIIRRRLEENNDNQDRMIIVFIDSQAALKDIRKNVLNVYQNKYILEIKTIHKELTEKLGTRILYIWIPAYMGITGNEIADGLAKQGAEE